HAYCQKFWKSFGSVLRHKTNSSKKTKVKMAGPHLWPATEGLLRHQSTVAPEAFTTLAQPSTSDLMKSPNSSGVVSAGTAPRSARRALTSGLASEARITSFSLVITSS